MIIREFQIGDEEALNDVFFSAVPEIANKDYTEEQINAWAPRSYDPERWAQRMRGISPFVVEIEGRIVAYAIFKLMVTSIISLFRHQSPDKVSVAH